MRVSFLAALALGCTPVDPVLEMMDHDPDWCPDEINDDIVHTWHSLACLSVECTGQMTHDECMDTTPPQYPRPIQGVTCFDGCAMRECLEGNQLAAECVDVYTIPELEACNHILRTDGEC